MKIVRNGILSCAALLALFSLNNKVAAQSKDFKTGQALEAQYEIIKNLKVGFVDSINVENLIDKGIKAMLESLDPYTEYLTDDNEEDYQMLRTATYGGIGSLIKKIDSVGVLISQPYFGSPAVKYGLEPGDVILKIDGEDVKPLTADVCSSKMKGQPGTDVKFLVRKGRTGKTEEITITRDRVHISDVSYGGIIKDDIGYIRLDGFTENGSQDFKNSLLSLKEKGMKKLIIDLRSNGGGIMEEAVNILSLFFPKGTEVVSAKGRAPEANFTLYTKHEPVDTLIPIVVLVNSGSASSSEIVAGAFQDLDRATIAGTRTYGKGLVQGFRPISYNGQLKLTISKYYTPSGRCVQALDYSNRNSDGSVGVVADSLKKAFKTKNGRTVYDGGGITPDTIILSEQYSRPAVSLVVNDIFGDYAIEFYKKNKSIAPAKDFTLSDSQYEDFVEYASKREWDSRSAALAQFDQMLKSAKTEKIYELYKDEFDALNKKLSVDKAQMLRIKRNEFQPLLEEEIVNKYYYSSGRIESIIRNDIQLEKAMGLFE